MICQMGLRMVALCGLIERPYRPLNKVLDSRPDLCHIRVGRMVKTAVTSCR